MVVKIKAKKEVETKSRLRIKLRSYDSRVMDKTCEQIIEMAGRASVETIGPVPLPTEVHRYTVNRSALSIKIHGISLK